MEEPVTKEEWIGIPILLLTIVLSILAFVLSNLAIAATLLTIAGILWYTLTVLAHYWAAQADPYVDRYRAQVRLGCFTHHSNLRRSGNTVYYDKNYATFPLEVKRPTKGSSVVLVLCNNCAKNVYVRVRSTKRAIVRSLVIQSIAVCCVLYLFVTRHFNGWIEYKVGHDNMVLVGISLLLPIVLGIICLKQIFESNYESALSCLDSGPGRHKIFSMRK